MLKKVDEKELKLVNGGAEVDLHWSSSEPELKSELPDTCTTAPGVTVYC